MACVEEKKIYSSINISYNSEIGVEWHVFTSIHKERKENQIDDDGGGGWWWKSSSQELLYIYHASCTEQFSNQNSNNFWFSS